MSDPDSPHRLHLISWLAPGIDASVFELAADVISATLNRPVGLELISESSGPTDEFDPFSDHAADFGWMCSTSFVQSANARLVGVSWAPDDADTDGLPLYYSDLVTASGVVADIEALQGLRVGCNDPVSLSGHYGLRFALDDAGHVLDDHAEVVFTGGHLASLDAVRSGEVDAAVIDSITRHVHGRDLVVSQRLGPWPTQPLVAGPAITTAELGAVRDAVLIAHEQPAAADVLRSAGLLRFAPVDVNDYEVVARRLVPPPAA